MKKLAFLLALVFLMVGVTATAQEYQLQLIVFNIPQDTVSIGDRVTVSALIWNPAPYGSNIYLSGLGYMTIDTPWGFTINRGPIPINNVRSASARRANWTMPVGPAARMGVYTFTGWVEMDGEVVGLLTDSVEVVP